MDQAVTLAKMGGNDHVDRALRHGALLCRFAYSNLASILNDISRPTTHAANGAPP